MAGLSGVLATILMLATVFTSAPNGQTSDDGFSIGGAGRSGQISAEDAHYAKLPRAFCRIVKVRGDKVTIWYSGTVITSVWTRDNGLRAKLNNDFEHFLISEKRQPRITADSYCNLFNNSKEVNAGYANDKLYMAKKYPSAKQESTAWGYGLDYVVKADRFVGE